MNATSHSPLDVNADPELAADVALVERFTNHWSSNAKAYAETQDAVRAAARRVLTKWEAISRDGGGSSGGMAERLRGIADLVACLARQPLYFTEMFHGQKLLSDGSYTDLEWSHRVHFLPGGILLDGDRVAIAQIYDRIFRSRNSPLRVVEIGSAVGRGSTRIGGEFVKRSDGLLYCIDPWVDSDWHFAFLANVKIFDLESTIIPIRSSSSDAAKLFDDESLDAVFIDGSHIYPDVLADIDAYIRKVRKNGFLFGHDLHDLPSRFNRSELLSVAGVNNTDVNYTNARGEVARTNVHPGVILAVQDRFGDDVEQFPDSVVWAKQV